MAERKVTVLNPAGYQEQLPDTDNLLLAAAPALPNHAANKAYVDSGLANIDLSEIEADIEAIEDRVDIIETTYATKVYVDAADQNLQDQLDAIIEQGEIQNLDDVLQQGNTSSLGAEFGGNVGTGSATLDANGSRLRPSGLIETRRDGNDSSIFTAYSGGNAAGNIVVDMGNDGSAVFNNTIYLNSNGSIVTSGANNDSYILQGKKGSSKNVEIFANGAATFLGKHKVEVSGDYAHIARVSSGSGKSCVYAQHMDGGNVFEGASSDGIKSTIAADGSATFASNATEISSSGAISVNRTAGTNDVFTGQINGSITSNIKADGSATFAADLVASTLEGDIDCGNY